MNYAHHPCFSADARHRVGRIHLPVAPKCNMQCNYCSRDFDCLNESRPGVSSTILTPLQAADYLDRVLEKIGNIEVVGIAGPGDPFANAAETLETLRIVRERHPDMILCLATNGLEVAEHADDLARLKVSHVTITVNATDPRVGEKIYAWARANRRIYRGLDAARIIAEKQRQGIKALKERGMIVKVNTVVIRGINDTHVAEIAQSVSAMGVDILNCIPLYHVAGTPLEHVPPLESDEMESIRREAGAYLPQMSHCTRCRADAAGLIGEDRSGELVELLREASLSQVTAERPFVAVASMEGLLVNQHLGEAAALWIFGEEQGRAHLVERRPTPASGGGTERWNELVTRLKDCNTILVSGIGPYPQYVVERAGIRVVVMEGMAAEGVEAVLAGREVPRMLLRPASGCGIGKQCTGGGTGCG
ncbi:MAG TPA: radical SAM protein [Syntrophorhabdales bacterium]|nr:radical SAM protein [Syntrophorhabdales bacterium]